MDIRGISKGYFAVILFFTEDARIVSVIAKIKGDLP